MTLCYVDWASRVVWWRCMRERDNCGNYIASLYSMVLHGESQLKSTIAVFVSSTNLRYLHYLESFTSDLSPQSSLELTLSPLLCTPHCPMLLGHCHVPSNVLKKGGIARGTLMRHSFLQQWRSACEYVLWKPYWFVLVVLCRIFLDKWTHAPSLKY